MTTNMKRILVLLASAGVIAVVVGGSTGTFASFNAQVTNPGNTFKTGTLFLHNTSGATTCTSESAPGNANDGTGVNGDTCATFFNLTNQTGKSAQPTYQLTLSNAGTLPATDIKFYSSTCSHSTVGVGNGTVGTGSATTNVVLSSPTTVEMPDGSQVSFGSNTTKYTTDGATPPGSSSITLTTTPSPLPADTDAVLYYPAFPSTAAGNLCTQLGLTIYDMESSNSSDPGDATSCVFPATSCGTTPTVFSSLPDSGTPATLTGMTLAAGASKNFLIQVNKPDLGNAYQSQSASIDLTWKIDD